MRRRKFIALMGASVPWPFAALAQEPGRMYRVGGLNPFPRDTPVVLYYLEKLRQRGFIEGQNLMIETRDYGIHPDLISEYAAELVRAQCDVISAAGGAAIRAAQQATKTIPIVGVTDDMVGEGFVDSLVRPGGNTTGVSILASELDGKRQELLIEAVPELRWMAALADSKVTTIAKLNEMQEAARARNVELSIHQVASGGEIAAAIDNAKSSGAAALNVLGSPMLHANHQLIMDRVASLRWPAMYQWPELVEEGGFAGYGPGIIQLQDLTVRLAANVLLGKKPADLPIEQPTKFELWINLKTAKVMGVTVPEALLARADKVIE
jgi:putative tryptophan/tyrosine transport system substrate-binding protein